MGESTHAKPYLGVGKRRLEAALVALEPLDLLDVDALVLVCLALPADGEELDAEIDVVPVCGLEVPSEHVALGGGLHLLLEVVADLLRVESGCVAGRGDLGRVQHVHAAGQPARELVAHAAVLARRAGAVAAVELGKVLRRDLRQQERGRVVGDDLDLRQRGQQAKQIGCA